jgi:dTDP-4-amino-4,6-dideoxygalactose transaminase
MKVPFNSLKTQLAPLHDSLRGAFERVLAGGWYLNGQETAAFEREFAAFADTGRAVAVSSGTDALVLCFKALGLGPGDEIILPAHTAPPCYHAVLAAGCTPVFAEVDQDYCLEPEAARKLVGPKVKALLAVHLYGQCCDMTGLSKAAKDNGLFLVEDCSQAHGARHKGTPVGSFGRLAAFSFYPTKNLGALGDAGAVCCADEDLAENVARLKEYGEAERYRSTEPGLNCRMDELQAAFLRERLHNLGPELVRREELAQRYLDGLEGLPLTLPKVRAGCMHAWHLFVVRTKKRDELKKHLEERGIGSAVHYPIPGHKQPMFAKGVAKCRKGALSLSEKLASEVLSLPLYPGLAPEQVDTICKEVRAYYGA